MLKQALQLSCCQTLCCHMRLNILQTSCIDPLYGFVMIHAPDLALLRTIIYILDVHQNALPWILMCDSCGPVGVMLLSHCQMIPNHSYALSIIPYFKPKYVHTNNINNHNHNCINVCEQKIYVYMHAYVYIDISRTQVKKNVPTHQCIRLCSYIHDIVLTFNGCMQCTSTHFAWLDNRKCGLYNYISMWFQCIWCV